MWARTKTRARSLTVQDGIPVWECLALGDHAMSLSFSGPLVMWSLFCMEGVCCSLGQPGRSLDRMPQLSEMGCLEKGVSCVRG
jgi:hypothetical protein